MKRFVLPRALYGPFEETERVRARARVLPLVEDIPLCEISVTRMQVSEQFRRQHLPAASDGARSESSASPRRAHSTARVGTGGASPAL